MVRRLIAFATLPLLLTSAISVCAQAPAKIRQSTLENGVYHHNRTGVEFTLPAGWTFVSEGHADFGGHSVLLRDSDTGAFATVWMKSQHNEPADIPGLLERRLDVKLLQRNNFQDYKLRIDGVQHITVGANQGISVVADYVNVGQRKAEYHTWVYSGKTHLYFDGRVPEAQLPAFQERFNVLIQSAVMP
jgi:hypothetical protein